MQTRLLEFTRQSARKKQATQRENARDLWRFELYIQQNADWCTSVKKLAKDGKKEPSKKLRYRTLLGLHTELGAGNTTCFY